MNKKSIFAISFIWLFFATIIVSASENQASAKPVNMPDDVKAVIEKSCYGCHNTDSKNDKAKEKLDLKTLGELDTPKMIHALKEINKEVSEDEMPPAKFLERFPDKKLTDAEKKILLDWANNEAKSLMK